MRTDLGSRTEPDAEAFELAHADPFDPYEAGFDPADDAVADFRAAAARAATYRATLHRDVEAYRAEVAAVVEKWRDR